MPCSIHNESTCPQPITRVHRRLNAKAWASGETPPIRVTPIASARRTVQPSGPNGAAVVDLKGHRQNGAQMGVGTSHPARSDSVVENVRSENARYTIDA